MRPLSLLLVVVISLAAVSVAVAGDDIVSLRAVWGLGTPNDLVLSADALLVATGAGILSYDPLDWDAPPRLIGPSDRAVYSLALDPVNANRLAAAVLDGIEIVNRATGAVERVLPHDAGFLDDLQFSAGGARLLALGQSHAYIWDVRGGDLLQILGDAQYPLLKAALSPDGRLVFAGSADGALTLWDVDTGALLRDDFPVGESLGLARTTAVAFTPDGSHVAAGDFNGHFRLWPLAGDGYLEYERPYIGDPNTPTVREFRFLPDGRLVTAEDSATGGLRLWSLDGAVSRLAEIDPPGFSSARSPVPSPDGQSLAAIVSSDLHGVTVDILDLETFTPRASLDDFAPFNSVTLSPDGRYLLASGYRAMRLLDTSDGSPARDLAHEGLFFAFGAAIDDANNRVAACLNDNTIAFEPALYAWSLPESSDAFLAFPDITLDCLLPFFHEGRLHVLTSRGVYVATQPAAQFDPLLPLDGPIFASNAVFAGGRLAFSENQQPVTVYDLAAPDALPLIIPRVEHDRPAEFGTPPLALNADGRLLARRAGPDVASVEIYDLGGAAPALRQTLVGSATVTALAFSPDGRLLAAGHSDGAITLWDWESGSEIARVRGALAVRSLAFSPDSATLYSAGDDRVIRVWTIATGNGAN